jgi:hypothetical protein
LTFFFHIIVSLHANVDYLHVIVAFFYVNVISLQTITIDSLCIVDIALHITSISFHCYYCYYYFSLFFFFCNITYFKYFCVFYYGFFHIVVVVPSLHVIKVGTIPFHIL